jgi:hypothetical protein
LARIWHAKKPGVEVIKNEGMDWWTRWDSNPRPPRCERGALPAELLAHEMLAGLYNHIK